MAITHTCTFKVIGHATQRVCAFQVALTAPQTNDKAPHKGEHGVLSGFQVRPEAYCKIEHEHIQKVQTFKWMGLEYFTIPSW